MCVCVSLFVYGTPKDDSHIFIRDICVFNGGEVY